MWERYARPVRIRMSWRRFLRLPQHPAYKTEYYGGRAVLSYRPRFSFVRMRVADGVIADGALEDGFAVRRLVDDDWPALPPVMAAAFHRTAPFDAMGDDAAVKAADAALAELRGGKEGPFVAAASFVAEHVHGDERHFAGAALVCRPKVRSHAWPVEGDRPDACPHLTWLFVAPFMQRHGIATALLARVVAALRSEGETWLTSGFYAGNAASTLFHWRHKFELLPDIMSRQEWQKRKEVQ